MSLHIKEEGAALWKTLPEPLTLSKKVPDSEHPVGMVVGLGQVEVNVQNH